MYYFIFIIKIILDYLCEKSKEMADNYLEKRYRDVFGSGHSVDPETGYERTSGSSKYRKTPAGLQKPKGKSPTGGK